LNEDMEMNYLKVKKKKDKGTTRPYILEELVK
jgi:hypothetical protein